MRRDRPGWEHWGSSVRPQDADALDRLCRQRGWSRADLLRSLVSPGTGHEKINRNVNALSFQVPERMAALALSALNSTVSETRAMADRVRRDLPAHAGQYRELADQMEDAVRYFGGIVRDYARLREAKGLPQLVGASQRHDADP